jgi:hypothetical protein
MLSFGRDDMWRAAFTVQCALAAHVGFYRVGARGRQPTRLDEVLAPDGLLPLIGKRIVIDAYRDACGRAMPAVIERADDTLAGAVIRMRDGQRLDSIGLLLWVVSTVEAIDIGVMAAGTAPGATCPLARRLRWLGARFKERRPSLEEWVGALHDPECPPQVEIDVPAMIEALRRDHLPFPEPGEAPELEFDALQGLVGAA